MADGDLPPPGAEHDPAYDGATAAPASHVVVYEDGQRELLVVVAPGQREPFHHHLRRSEMRVFRSAPLRYYHADGRTDDLSQSDATPDRPVVAQLDPEPLHAVENLSERNTYYALRIEFKVESARAAAGVSLVGGSDTRVGDTSLAVMREPTRSRPYMPGYGIHPPDEGSGLLPWSWAEQRLHSSHTFWVVTLWPDGRPHAMPVWGVWRTTTPRSGSPALSGHGRR